MAYPRDFWALLDNACKQCGTSPQDLLEMVGYNLLMSKTEMVGWISRTRQMIDDRRKDGWTAQHFGLWGWVREILIDKYNLSPQDATDALVYTQGDLLNNLVNNINRGGDARQQVISFACYTYKVWTKEQERKNKEEEEKQAEEQLKEEEELEKLYNQLIEETKTLSDKKIFDFPHGWHFEDQSEQEGVKIEPEEPEQAVSELKSFEPIKTKTTD